MQSKKLFVILVVLTNMLLGLAFAQENSDRTQTPTEEHSMMKDNSRVQNDTMSGCTSEMMPSECEKMMDEHENLKKIMKNMDDKLNKLVEEMNKASQNKKLEAVVAVINELVKQRRTLHERMMTMQPMMMNPTTMHKQNNEKHSMMNCPMMKKTKE